VSTPRQRDGSDVRGLIGSLVKCTDLLVVLGPDPTSKRDLADALGVSKSTVYNWFSELEAHDLAERADGGYRFTPVGELYADLYFHTVERGKQLRRAAGLLAELPSEALPPITVFDEAEIVTFEHDPDRPLAELLALSERATSLSGFFPFVPSRQLEFVADRLEGESFAAEFLLDSHTLDYLETERTTYAEALARSPAATLYRTERSLPFGLALVDDPVETVAVVAYTPRGAICGLIVSGCRGAVEWGTGLYEEYRDGAERFALDPA
jgi:predicted transcriptional regulator